MPWASTSGLCPRVSCLTTWSSPPTWQRQRHLRTSRGPCGTSLRSCRSPRRLVRVTGGGCCPTTSPPSPSRAASSSSPPCGAAASAGVRLSPSPQRLLARHLGRRRRARAAGSRTSHPVKAGTGSRSTRAGPGRPDRLRRRRRRRWPPSRHRVQSPRRREVSATSAVTAEPRPLPLPSLAAVHCDARHPLRVCIERVTAVTC
mmetsp:Transcript_7030/g.21335  ORF Transcript_7030/g.21335 Transcript_7030/m.21335 type:complete len:202 (+) Transcript_7030:1193-1798(+)